MEQDTVRPRGTSRSLHSDEVEKGSSKVEQEEVAASSKESAITTTVIDGDEALQLVGAARKDIFDDEFNAKLRRKLDRYIPTVCAAVYFTQFLDKNTLAYASVMDFPITGQHYNLVSAAFYIGFLTWEYPTSFLAQRTRIAKYLGVNVCLWGLMLMLQATTESFGAFFALRFLMGMLESCVAPILILLIGMFYQKQEQGRRISWFYVMNGLTKVFGSFVAFGISFIDSKFARYKILFLLLGAMAITVGVSVLIWLPDSPVRARMLTREEKIAALERVRDGQGGTENHHLKKEQVWEAVTDIRTWLIVLIVLTTSIPNGGVSNFSNIIVKSFGFTSRQTLILAAPGGGLEAFATLASGWYSDRKGERMIPIIFVTTPTIIGAAMFVGLAGTGQKWALLVASWLIGIVGASLSLVYTYNAGNIAGHTKKVTINAMTLFFFALGNIVGTEIFLPKDAPSYIPGKVAILVLWSLTLFATITLRQVNVHLNKKKKEHLVQLKERRGWSDQDLESERERHAFLDMTDKQNPFFVYLP